MNQTVRGIGSAAPASKINFHFGSGGTLGSVGVASAVPFAPVEADQSFVE